MLKKLNGCFLGLLISGWLVSMPAWGANKVAVIMSRSIGPYGEIIQGLHKNTKLEMKILDAEGNSTKARHWMESLSPTNTDLVITVGDVAVGALESLNKELPIVYTMIYSPLELPQRRVGGVILKIGIKQQLAKIRELFPERKRIGVVSNPAYSGPDIAEARNLCPQFDANLFVLNIDKAQDLPGVLDRFNDKTIDILWMVVDQTVAQPAVVQQLIAHCGKENLPFVGLSLYHVKLGAITAFSVDFNDIGSQVSELAEKMLAGNKAEIQTPRKILIHVNDRRMKEMKIENLNENSKINLVE